MIEDIVLRRSAAERGIDLGLIEKDYLLCWVLKGISATSVNERLIFKGGTALSRVYFPLDWRISEDLDFTLLDDSLMEDVSSRLRDELSSIVEASSGGIRVIFRAPYVTPSFLRVNIGLIGPITQHRTKIEITRESFLGDFYRREIQTLHDCPEFSLQVYTLENILAEKLRSLIERTRIRDYYDSWRLLSLDVIDAGVVRSLFLNKCEGKGVLFRAVDEFFPENIVELLEPYWDTLTRLTSEPLPSLEKMLEELRINIELLLYDG